jgi:hypothetical protein
VRFITQPATRDRLTNQMGADVAALGPGEFGRFMKSESEKWIKVIKAANLRADQ